jgi:hypothetical protein
MNHACTIANLLTQSDATQAEVAADKVVLVRLLTEYAPALANMFAQVRSMQTPLVMKPAATPKRQIASVCATSAAKRRGTASEAQPRKRVPLSMMYGS